MGRIFFVLVLLGYLAVALITALLAAAVVFQLAYDGDSKVEALVLFAGFALLLGMLLWRTSNPAILGLRGEDKHQHRAMAYLGLGMKDRALESIERHLQDHPDQRRSLHVRATLLADGQRWREAFEAIDRAVELDDGFGSLRFRVGMYSHLGLDAEAALDCQRLYDEDPSCVNRRSFIGALKGARRLERALQIADEAPGEHEMCVWHQRAEALRLLGRSEDARQWFEKVVDELDRAHPDQRDAWIVTTLDALGHLGRLKECRSFVHRMAPSTGDRVRVANVYLALHEGRGKDAMGYLRYALKVQPEWVISHLGDPDFSPLLETDARLREVLGLALLKRREMIADLGRPVGIF